MISDIERVKLSEDNPVIPYTFESLLAIKNMLLFEIDKLIEANDELAKEKARATTIAETTNRIWEQTFAKAQAFQTELTIIHMKMARYKGALEEIVRKEGEGVSPNYRSAAFKQASVIAKSALSFLTDPEPCQEPITAEELTNVISELGDISLNMVSAELLDIYDIRKKP